MKKLFVLALLCAVSLATFADTEESKDESTPQTTNKTLCHPENFSHWSLAIGGGANLMLGEKTVQNLGEAFGDYLNKNTNWAIKGEIEYMVNPVWGFNLQYMYDPYNKKNANEAGYTTDRDLGMHEVSFQFLVNILNVGRRTRTHTNWNWYAGLGAGVLCFQRNQDYNYSYRPAGMIVASTSVEYTPTPVLGIFAEGMWRWYADDRVNGIVGGQMKDMGLYGGIGLRFHIGATKKPHVRVTDVNTYEPLQVAAYQQEPVSNNRDIEGLQQKVDDLERQIAAMNKSPRTGAVSDAEIQAKVDAAVKNSNSDVQMQVNALKLQVGNMQNTTAASNYTTVYFDTNSAFVSSQYQLSLAKLAKRMLDDPTINIVVRGYCDSQGDVPYNKTLAQKRIDSVMDILVRRYKVDRSRISSECIGRVNGANEIDILNRRCDVIIK